MKRLAIRAGLAVLGMAITLTWWTIHHGDSHSQSSRRIPDKVWSGGHTLEIEVESTSTATMRVISFSQHDKPAGEQQTLETYEMIAAGTRSWTIEVPAHVGGYIEIEAENPNPGNRLAMKVKSNGKLVDEQTENWISRSSLATPFFSRFITTTIRTPVQRKKCLTAEAAALHPARTSSRLTPLSFRPRNSTPGITRRVDRRWLREHNPAVRRKKLSCYGSWWPFGGTCSRDDLRSRGVYAPECARNEISISARVSC